MNPAITIHSDSSPTNDPAPTPYDDLLARATKSLSPDPELQCEVRQELLGHLEDAAEEYREAGNPNPIAQAVKALGDPDELSNKLLETHRRRLRMRKFARWTLRATIVPIATGLTIAIAWSALLTVAAGLHFNQRRYFADDNPVRSWAERLALASMDQQLAKLKPEERQFISTGLISNRTWEARASAAKALSDSAPLNPIFYANYINARYAYYDEAANDYGQRPVDPVNLAPTLQAISELEHGEQLEPDNGWYNVLKAFRLFRQSSQLIEDPQLRSEATSRSRPEYALERVKIIDEAMFHRGLEQWRIAASKPLYTDHVVDLEALRLHLLPQPRRLDDLLLRERVAMGSNPMTWGHFGRCVAATCAFDLSQAEQNPAAKLEWISLSQRLAAHTAIETRGIHRYAERIWLMAQQYRIKALRAEGKPGETSHASNVAVDLGAQLDIKGGEYFDAINRRQSNTDSWFGTLLRTQYAVPNAALRRAEYAVSDRMAVAGLLALLAVIASLLLAKWAIDQLSVLMRSSPQRIPGSLFVGWRSLARINLLAVILPLILYAAWSRFIAMSARQWGLHVTYGQVLTEYFILANVILSLLWRLTLSAIRRRCAELGISTPRPAGRGVTLILPALGSILAIAAIAMVHYHLGPQLRLGDSMTRFNLILCFALLYWILIRAVDCYDLLHRKPKAQATQGTAHMHRHFRWVIPLILLIAGASIPISNSLANGSAWITRTIGSELSSVYIFALALLLFAIVLPLTLRRFWHDRLYISYPTFRRTLAGSMLPVLASAILLLAIFVGYPLQRAESSAVRATGSVDNVLPQLDRPSLLEAPSS